MKYSIGDRVIVKESEEKAIVVGEGVATYIVYSLVTGSVFLAKEYELLTDLTAIEKPFGLLSEEVQEELKAVDNGRNIQYYGDDWFLEYPAWDNSSTYRLDPAWKQEEVKEMTVGEIEAKLGHRVKVVKGE